MMKLRPFNINDAETILSWCNDALHTWAIVLKDIDEPIGAMGYGPSCECDLPAREGEPLIGYWVAKPYWNEIDRLYI